MKVWTATYRPFGEVVTSTGTLSSARFPGQWFQSESGLHQNWMRDYDPKTGRYLEPDPLGLIDGASVYGYVKQSPGRWIDPRGEQVPVTLIPTCLILGGGASCILPQEPLHCAKPETETFDCENGCSDLLPPPPPPDYCTSKYMQCVEFGGGFLPGRVKGETLCGSCAKACREVGYWPKSIRKYRGGYLMCVPYP